MKKLLEKVNRDIRESNLGTAINRVEKFIRWNSLIIRESSKHKKEMNRISKAFDHLPNLAAAEKYEAQSNITSQIQTLADRITTRKVWPAIVSFLGLVATVIAIWQFVFPEKNCPGFDKSKDCTLLITKISSPEEDKGTFIMDQIVNGVQKNEVLNVFASIGNATAINNPDYYKTGDEVAIQCIKDCKNQYSIYGSYLRGRKKLEYSIVDKNGVPEHLSDQYNYMIEPEGLEYLKDDLMSQNLAGNVLANSISSACKRHVKDPEIYATLAASVNSPVEKQAVFNEAHLYHINTGDTSLAIHALDQVEDLSDNQYAVFALEKSADLSMETKQYANAYERQSRYINKVTMRLEAPEKFRIGPKLNAYQTAFTQMRINRGMNVYRNLDAMSLTRNIKIGRIETAIADFEMVDANRYRDQIRDLQRRLADLNQPGSGGSGSESQIGQVIIQLRNAIDGSNIPNARILFDNTNLVYNNGSYIVEGEQENFIGKTVRISANGYHSATKVIQFSDLNLPISVNLRPLITGENQVLNIRVQEAETGRGFTDGFVVFNDERYEVDGNSRCTITGTEESLVGKTISAIVEGFGRQSQQITSTHLQNGMTFLMTAEAPWRVELEPMDAQKRTVISDATMTLRGRNYTLDDTNGFLLEGSGDELINAVAILEAPGYEPKEFIIQPKHLDKRVRVLMIPGETEPTTIRISGVVMDESGARMPGVNIGSKFSQQVSDTEGLFQFEVPANIDLSNETVSFSLDNFESRRIPIPDIQTRPRVVMKKKATMMTYTISGKVKLCDDVMPNIKAFKVGPNTVKLRKDRSYRTELTMEAGSSIDIQIPSEYRLRQNSSSTITLGNNSSITHNLSILLASFSPMDIIITGVALSNGKPMEGATIGFVGKGGKTTKASQNGTFRLQMQWTNQCSRFKLYARNERWGHNESGLLYPLDAWAGTPSRVDFGNINFTWISAVID